MTDWYVGQKVVCIDDERVFEDRLLVGKLVRGSVYTIRSIALWKGELGFLVEEIACSKWIDGDECGFWASRFRPLVNQNADISVFERLLEPLNNREVVDA